MIVLLGGFLLLMIFGVPVAVSMALASLAYLAVHGGAPDVIVAQRMIAGVESFPLLAVPFFILAGNLMNIAGVTGRIYAFAVALVGWMRGGLAQVNILVSVIFSGMSGSAIADAAGPGLVTIRQMLKKPEYTPGFAGAVVVASATLGPIIPPSIPMVIYALVSGASMGALFLGGVVPGFLMAFLMMGVVAVIAAKRKMPREAPIPMSEWPAILFRGALPLSMPIVLLGGIYSGAFTPTEAAAVAAFHALILAGVVYRALTWKTFWGVVMESTRGSAVITIILAGSFMLNYAFTAEGVPQSMAHWVDTLQLSRLSFLLLVNLIFLVLGCFLDVSVLLLVFVPMLLPAVKALGIDLVHFGVLVVLNMMIGMIHPPFGMLLFVTKALTGIPIGDMMKEGWPFLVMLLILLLAMTIFPQIVLWLPQTMGYGGS